MNTTLSEN